MVGSNTPKVTGGDGVARSMDFWNQAANGFYDQLVLGNDAPYDIKRLLAEEDKILINAVDSYVENGRDLVFVELGSGTGRYLKLLGKKVILDRLYGKHLKYIIGVDFSEPMITTSINNLVRSGRTQGKREPSLAEGVSLEARLSIQEVETRLRERILFIRADGTKPFLKSHGINIVIGIMFGTFGNIPQQEELLQNIADSFEDSGKLIITVFNREFKGVGFKGYSQLAAKGFRSLSPLVWDEEASVFTSGAGFYSRWFSHEEFKGLLNKHFSGNLQIVSVAIQGLLATVNLEGGKESGRHLTSGKLEPAINLLCPICGQVTASLPSEVRNIACSSCGAHYNTEVVRGFRVTNLIP